MIEICAIGADVVIWHENMILGNEFDVTTGLYDDSQRFLQNTLIRWGDWFDTKTLSDKFLIDM